MPSLAFPITDDNDDAFGFYSDTSWPPTGGTFSAENDTLMAAAKNFSGPSTFGLANALMRFDTSGLESWWTVTAASLELVFQSNVATDNRDFVGDYYDFGGAPVISSDVVETITPTAFSVTQATLATFVVVSIALSNVGNINKEGFTGIRAGISGGQPTDSNSLNIFDSSSVSDDAEDPRLVITVDTGDTQVIRRAYGGGLW